MPIEPGLVFTLPIRADRAAEFEEWIRTVLRPAIDGAGKLPDYRLYRADGGPDGVALYVVIGEGDDPDPFELQPLLEEALGEERGRVEFSRIEDLIAQEQDLWILRPMD